MGLSVFVTQSRSGMACVALALLLVGGVLARQREASRSRRPLAAYVGSVLFLILLGLGWGGLEAALSRYGEVNRADMGGRVPIWNDAARIVADFPLTGTGLNSYERAAMVYRTTSYRHQAAHNDYLELAADGGVLVGVPVLLAGFMFLREVWRRFRQGLDDPLSFWLRTGAAIGLVAVASQEMFEFSLQMPGNTALFVVLCAIAIHRGPRPVAATGARSTVVVPQVRERGIAPQTRRALIER
jgi:O-antigen ligase